MLFSNIEEFKKAVTQGLVQKFKIKAIPSSKVENIEFCDEYIKIKIKDKAIEGRANKAIIEFLSNVLKIPKSKIKIASGEKSSIKLIQLLL